MERPHVLIIEDDPSVCELLFSRMKKAGFRPTATQFGEEGLSLIETDPPDLVILDLQLPGMSGLDVCRTMRRDPWMSRIPVLMLTGQTEEDDMIAGLEVGADDYMTKPFSAKVLDARVKALLRRGHSSVELVAIAGASSDAPPSIPKLVLKTLGKCEIRLAETSLYCSEQFSPAQRQLLAMLLVSPSCTLAQEAVQLAFWPESSEARARSSFDSLLSRVRKTLELSFPGIDSKLYLNIRRGVLSLEHIQVDVHEFRRLCQRGLQQVVTGDFWQAELSFSAAFSLWQGTFLPGDFGNEAAARYQDEVEQLYQEASDRFGRVLAQSGRLEEAIKVVEYARRYDMLNDDLVQLHYRLLISRNLSTKAHGLLDDYRNLLEREKYSSEEIDEILVEIEGNVSDGDWLSTIS